MDRTRVSKIQEANLELFVKGHLDAIPEFFTTDYVAHVTDQAMTGGHRVVRRVLSMLLHSFESIQVDVEILVEGRDRIAWQRTLRGTHQEDFMGFPASGRQLVWRDMVTSRFHEGRIAEEWVISDLAERLLRARK